jgi:glycosyltransferase involved in cell wall biosynthesis
MVDPRPARTSLEEREAGDPTPADTRPAVSVVIPAYNAAGFIRTALDSVLNQTFEDFEVVVVDDGSCDDTASIVQGYGARVRLYSQRQGGASKARNHGISKATGELVAFLDADDLWRPRKLERQVDLFRRRPDLGLVATGHEVVYDRFPTKVSRPDKRQRLFSDGNVARSILINSGILTSSIMVPRKILRDLGGFNEDLRIGEDDDLWIRITVRHPADLVDEVLVRHRVREGSLSKDQELLFSDVLKSLDGLMVGDPKVKASVGATVPKKRAIILCDRGYYYFDQERSRDARVALVQALKQNPKYLRAWKYLLFSCIPTSIRRLLRQAKRRTLES